MKILEAVFDGYIRIATTGYQYFKFTPTELLQIFLGTNGSGKSSLIVEMFPFAPNRHDFKPGGYKRVRYLHRDKEYEVEYRITQGRKEGELSLSYSFKSKETWGWWEQNPNSKAPMQLELIEKYFNLTPEIRDYLTGDKLFTDIGPTERRVIFTKMSDADYTFGLKLFDQAKKKHRNTLGAIEFVKERISAESAKLISKEEARELEALQESLHQALNKLYRERNNQIESSTEYLQRANVLDTKLTGLSNQVLNAPGFDFKGLEVNDLASLTSRIQGIDQEVYALNVLLQNQAQQHDVYVRDRERLKALGEEGLEGVYRRIQTQEAKVKALKDTLSEPWAFTSNQSAHEAFESILEDLTRVFSELPDNSERYYSSATLQALRTERLDTQQTLGTHTQTQLAIKTKLNHQYEHRHSRETVCPNCQHHWVIGFNEAVMLALEADLQANQALVDSLQAKLEGLDAKIADVLAFLDTYRVYLNVRNTTKILQPLWTVLDADNLSFVSPRGALSIIHRLQRDFPVLIEIDSLQAAIDRDRLLAESLKQTDMEKLKTVNTHADALEHQIASNTAKLRDLQHQRNDYQQLHRGLERLLSLGREIETTLNDSMDNQIQLTKALHNEYVNESIRVIQRQLGVTETKFNMAQNQVGLIEELNNQLYELELQAEAYKAIVRQLSPTEGLIAEGLFGFIQAYVTQMNHFIKSMWSYPMEVLPSKLKDDSMELAYYFPMVLPNRDHPIDDVKYCSKGMRSVVNLAFKIIMIKYLGLMDIPLVLDEFGDGLDDRHRSSSAVVIQRIIEQMKFEQVFFVSHYVESYGALANSEICLLDASNVQVTLKHNQHVEMR